MKNRNYSEMEHTRLTHNLRSPPPFESSAEDAAEVTRRSRSTSSSKSVDTINGDNEEKAIFSAPDFSNDNW